MQSKLKIALVVVLLAAAGLVGALTWSQARTTFTPTNQPTQLFAAAQPHLEAALGYPLPKTLEFRIVGQDELRKHTDLAIHAQLAHSFGSLQGEARKQAYSNAQGVLLLPLLAKLSPGTNTILVVPAHGVIIAKWKREFGEAASPAFLQLLLVQEAARCALEQRYGLVQRRAAYQTPEDYWIEQALVDGRSLQLTRQVAEKLGCQTLFALLLERFKYVPDVAPDAQARTLCEQVLRQQRWANEMGVAFWDFMSAQGKADEAKIFSRPPRALRWLEKPAEYLASGVQERPDLRQALRHVQLQYTGDLWHAEMQPWNPEIARQVASLVQMQERAARVTAEWNDGQCLIWRAKASPMQHRALSVVRFNTEAAARSYFGFAGELLRKRDELSVVGCNIPVRVQQTRYGTAPLSGVEETLRNDKQLLCGTSTQSIAATVVLARAGSHALEMQWLSVEPDLTFAQRVFLEVLAAK